MIFEKLPKANLNDKEHLFAVADFITKLSEKARREGLLALWEGLGDDDYMPSSFGKLEKFLFTQIELMMVNAVDQELIVEFAKNYISSIDEDEPSLLALMIETRGVLSIQAGENPYTLAMILASMMGHPLCEEYYESRLKDEND